MSDEKRLIKKLLDDYEKVGIVGRPVNNTSQTISVSYGLSLIQILDLDEKNQVLTTNVWSRYAWVDILLTWEPAEYGGIDLIRVPSTKIWTPDIVLYNYADTRLKEQRDAMVVVQYNGSVIWIPPAIFKSTCQIDIQNFPFDIQKCHLKFGSWTYDGYKLDINFLNGESVDVAEYMKSNEWELVEWPAIKNVKHYAGLEEPYPDLTFYLKMKRVAAFYNYILILPCVLLSFLTLVIFWLPPESPAKVMLGMSVFVAFFVLLLLLAESTPPAASTIPLIGAYFCMNMILITLSTFLAVIIIQTHIRGDRKNKVPNWLRKVAIDGMARILCMSELLDKEPAKQQQKPQERKLIEESTFHHKHSSHEKRSTARSTGGAAEVNFNRIQPSLGGARDGSVAPSIEQPGPEMLSPPPPVSVLESDIKEIRILLKSYLGRLENKDSSAKNAKEWRLVARVLDRLFFLTYIGTIFVSMCTVFHAMGWDDVVLRWNPENYGGIQEVRVPVAKIWKPDIVLYNYADERLKEQRDAMAVVQSTGSVLWLPAAIFKSTCSINILYFPFDIQSCELKFGSWTYDGFKLDLDFHEQKETIDVTNYVPSNEWLLLSHPGRKNAKTYPCCPEPYYDLTYTINIKRIPIFHTFTLIIPCLLLSLLTLVSFWLPPETPAKILLGMNLFLAFFLLLKLLSGSTPASSSIPLIGAYFCLNMVLITLSSFISATVINLYKRDDKRNRVPEWVKKLIIDGLSRFLCMEQRKGLIRKKTRRDHVTHHVTHVIDGAVDGGRKSHVHEKTIKSPVLPYNKWEAPAPARTHAGADSPIATHQSYPYPGQLGGPIGGGGVALSGSDLVLETEVKEMKRMLKNFMSKVQMRDAKERAAMEWRLVALAIDRFFFYLYVVTVFISTLTIYIQCYLYYESAEHLETPPEGEEKAQTEN